MWEGNLDSIFVYIFVYICNNKIFSRKLWKVAARKLFTYRFSLPPFPNLPSPFQPGFCYFLTLNWISLSKILYFSKILIYFSACILQELHVSNSWQDRRISLEIRPASRTPHYSDLLIGQFLLFASTSNDWIPQSLILRPLLFSHRILDFKKSYLPTIMRFKYP